MKGTTSELRHNAGLGDIERELILSAKSDVGYQALILSHEMTVKEPPKLRRLPLGSVWRLLDHTLLPRGEHHPGFSSRDVRAVLLARETHLIEFAKHVRSPEGHAVMTKGASADREAFACVDAVMHSTLRTIREEAAVFTQALDRGVRDPLAPLTASRSGAEFAGSLNQ